MGLCGTACSSAPCGAWGRADVQGSGFASLQSPPRLPRSHPYWYVPQTTKSTAICWWQAALIPRCSFECHWLVLSGREEAWPMLMMSVSVAADEFAIKLLGLSRAAE